VLPQLPIGWCWSDAHEQSELLHEYILELPELHPLAGIEVEVVAHREGSDDILLRHIGVTDNYSVVHLSWLGREELPNHPVVEFTGALAEFVSWEHDAYGMGKLA
jgi:hypothetical protein